MKERYIPQRIKLASKVALSALLGAALMIGASLSAQSPDTNSGDIMVKNQNTLLTFAGGTAKSGGVLKVRINGPKGRHVFETTAKSGLVDWVPDGGLPNGVYKYDVWFTPAAATTGEYATNRDEVVSKKGIAPELETRHKSGTIRLDNGTLLDTQDQRMQGESLSMQEGNLNAAERLAGTILNWIVSDAHAQSVTHNGDDVDIEGGTPFIRYFESDNDSAGDFFVGVYNDTTLTIEGDSSRPAKIEQAPTDSLFVEASGDIGFGTATPSEDLHIVDGVPGIQLEDSDSGGATFTLRSFQGSPEFNILDASTGNTPFVIEEGASTNALYVDSTGNTGIGTGSPSAPLHVLRSDGSAHLRVEETNSTEASRLAIQLVNNGSPLLRYQDTARGITWTQNPVGNSFVINKSGTGAFEFEMDGSGNVTIQGSLTEDSRQESKGGFAPVDAETVLAKLDSLSIEEWHYKHTPDSRHIGPMAEEFHATFGVGPKDGIAPRDLAGVALAAAKALKDENEALKAVNEELKAKVGEMSQMEGRLARLERHVAEMAE